MRLVALGLAAFVLGGPVRAQEAERLVVVGDVDGDFASEVVLVRGTSLELRDGPELATLIWQATTSAPGPVDTADPVVAMIGDVDGDGFADFAIGEPDAGRVRVVLGARSGEGLREVVVLGEEGDRFGASVTGVDLDGDGLSELVIGAPNRARAERLGCVDVYRAPFAAPAHELCGFAGLGASLERAFDLDGDGLGDLLALDGADAWVLADGEDVPALIDIFAASPTPVALGDVDGDDRGDVLWPFAALAEDDQIAAAGDVNGDLVADVLITRLEESRLVLGAAHGQAPREVWSGPRAHAIGDADGDGLADIASLVDGVIAIRRGRVELPGPIAVRVRSTTDPTPASRPRVALAAGPDLDEDGRRGDLLVGLPDLDGVGPDSGMVLLVPAGDVFDPARSVERLPAARDGALRESFGAALATGLVGLHPAVLVGAPGFDGVDPDFFDPFFDPLPESAVSDPGFIAGEDGGRVELEQWTAPRSGVRMHAGPHPHARLGASVAVIGDVDGDGAGEVAWSAPGFSPDLASTAAGVVMVMRLHRVNPVGDRLIPRGGWRIDGTRPGEGLGVLAALGDVDGDARADFAIGAPAVGEVHIVSGTSFFDGPPGPPPKGALRVLQDPRAGAGGRFGAAIAAGDFDGDGRDDFAVAAPLDGRVEVFFADERRATLELEGGEEGDDLVLCACDIDADALADLVVGRPGWDGADRDQGRVDVFGGRPDGLSQSSTWDLSGERAEVRLGLAIAPLDRNQDGVCDLAIAGLEDGAPFVAIHLGNDGARGRGFGLTVLDAFERRAVEPGSIVGQRDLAVVRVGPGAPFPGAATVELEARPAASGIGGLGQAEVLRRGAVGVEVSAGGLSPSTAYRVRARLRYPAAEAPLQPTSRWGRANVTAPGRVDFRTRENHAPLARPDRYRIAGGLTRIPLAWLLDNDYDADLDPLALDLVTDARGGTVTVDGDALVYRPDQDTPREDTFEYRLRDRFGAVSALTPVTLVVTPCELDHCRDGLVQGTFTLPTGARAGFSCRVRRDLYPPRVECPVDADGTLSLSSPATCARGADQP